MTRFFKFTPVLNLTVPGDNPSSTALPIDGIRNVACRKSNVKCEKSNAICGAKNVDCAADNLIYAAGLIGPSNIFGEVVFGGVAGVG